MSTYDPKLIQASFNGVILADFAEGTMIKVTQEGDHFEAKQGGAGATEWVNKNMNIYTVEFTLLQTSPINATLSGLLASDKASNDGTGPFLVKDNGTVATSLVSLPEARIVKAPDAEYADSTTGRTWTLKACGAGAFVIGGN